MSIKVKVAATVLAAAFAVSLPATMASAVYVHKKKIVPHEPKFGSSGKLIVGCIMGSAAGLIYASIVKGGGIKWMTQKEWEDLKVKVPHPLTNEQAVMIASTCGLAAFLVKRESAPAVVRAGG